MSIVAECAGDELWNSRVSFLRGRPEESCARRLFIVRRGLERGPLYNVVGKIISFERSMNIYRNERGRMRVYRAFRGVEI